MSGGLLTATPFIGETVPFPHQRLIPALPVLIALLAPPCWAQSPGLPQVESMERITVTSAVSRVAEYIDSVPATVSIITRRELERDLSFTFRDMLRYEPGVSIENGAARFGLGNINIRGLDGNRVQMMVDGIRLPDNYRIGSFSNASRNALDLGFLRRVEILRGPSSAMYGSDALAGVVAFTTVDPVDFLKGGSSQAAELGVAKATVTGGFARSVIAAARAGRFELLAGYERSDGSETSNQGSNQSTGAQRTAPNPQSVRGESWIAKAVLPTAAWGTLSLAWDRYERGVNTDVLSLNPQSSRTVSLLGDDRAERNRVSFSHEVLALPGVDSLKSLIYHQISTTRQNTEEVRANTTAACLSAPGTIRCQRNAEFHFAQRESGLTVIGESKPGARNAHRLVFGAEWAKVRSEEQRDGRQTNLNTGTVSNVVGTDVFPTRDFPITESTRLGAFVQDSVAVPDIPLTLIAGLRADRFRLTPLPDGIYPSAGLSVASPADSAWSPKLGLLYRLTQETTFTAQATAGFRAPPYSDVNIGLTNLPSGYSVIANADLKPETSRGAELGLRGRHARFEYDLTAFYTGYHDLIVSRTALPCPADPRCVPGTTGTFQSQNVTRARIFGIEARARYPFARGWHAQAGLSANQGDDLAKNVPLNSIDPPKLVAGVSYDAPDRSWGSALHLTHAATKSRIDRAAGTPFAPPSYTIADLVGHLGCGAGCEVNAGVFNLFDRKYWLWPDVRAILNPGASVDRYTQPGRSYSAQVRITF